VSFLVTLRHGEHRITDDGQVLLRLGTDAEVDQTIRGSLGHYPSYAPVLAELGLPGAGALTLSVYLLDPGRSPADFRAGPFQRSHRTTTVGQVRESGVPIWATDVSVDGSPLSTSSDHFDLVVSTALDALPDAYMAANKAERRRLRGILRPRSRRFWDCSESPCRSTLRPRRPVAALASPTEVAGGDADPEDRDPG
jgi:hypothetical protein